MSHRTCNKRSADFHGTLRAEFLTAKASYALFSVDDGFFVFYHDSRGGTYLHADAATDTFGFFHDRFGLKDCLKHTCGKPALAVISEFKALVVRKIFEILYDK